MSRNPYIFPPFPKKFNGKGWTTKVGQRVLQTYMKILGFGKYGEKTYGRQSDKPSFWPDEISWIDFKYPSYARIRDINLILENFCAEFHIDINTHHDDDNLCVEEPAKKKRVTSKKLSILGLMILLKKRRKNMMNMMNMMNIMKKMKLFWMKMVKIMPSTPFQMSL